MAYPTVDKLVTNEFSRCDMTCGQRRAIERRSLAITEAEDDNDIRRKYRPFIQGGTQDDWVSTLELTGVLDMAENDLRITNKRIKVLVLYGSLRRRSYSRLVALEACRILFRLGCDVRVFDPEGLPIKNDTDHTHPKVQELRELSTWSDGQVWVSPEQHGNLVRFVFPLIVPKVMAVLLTCHSEIRPPFLRIRSIGYLSVLEACVRLKAGHLPSPRCVVVLSHSMRSILCASSAAGCGCSQSQISPQFPRHTPSFRKKVNRRT